MLAKLYVRTLSLFRVILPFESVAGVEHSRLFHPPSSSAYRHIYRRTILLDDSSSNSIESLNMFCEDDAIKNKDDAETTSDDDNLDSCESIHLDSFHDGNSDVHEIERFIRGLAKLSEVSESQNTATDRNKNGVLKWIGSVSRTVVKTFSSLCSSLFAYEPCDNRTHSTTDILWTYVPRDHRESLQLNGVTGIQYTGHGYFFCRCSK